MVVVSFEPGVVVFIGGAYVVGKGLVRLAGLTMGLATGMLLSKGPAVVVLGKGELLVGINGNSAFLPTPPH